MAHRARAAVRVIKDYKVLRVSVALRALRVAAEEMVVLVPQAHKANLV